MRGFVHRRRGKWSLDLRLNFGSLVSNQTILDEMVAFLEEFTQHHPRGRVLDLGAGSKPYAPLYSCFFQDCTSVDVPHSAHNTSTIDVMASADDLPFEDQAFDCVICTEVLEHCADPAAVLREISRVLRPGGGAFITTPFLVPLHEMPYDFFRYTPSALQHLVEGAGLTLVAIRPRGSYLSVWMSVNQKPLTKLMAMAARRTGIPFNHPYNPLIFLLVVLPQQAYLLGLRWLASRPQSAPARVHEKLTYYANGYVTLAQKPEGPQGMPEA